MPDQATSRDPAASPAPPLPTADLACCLAVLHSLPSADFSALRLAYLAARIEAELGDRARFIHPGAIYNGGAFEVPFPPHDPQRVVEVPPAEFDCLAALFLGEVRGANF